MWDEPSSGGAVLMPLREYPFSKRYGWIQDKYGLSRQLILSNPGGEERPFIVPSLLFVGAVSGKAEEAVNFYLSVFKNSKRGTIAPYPKDMEPEKEGTTMFSDFVLENQWFAASGQRAATELCFQRSHFVPCKLRNATGRRSVFGKPFSGARGRAVRLAQGQVWSLVADHPQATRAFPGAFG